jgi:Ca2+-transporting ATPase
MVPAPQDQSSRSERESLFQQGLRSNMSLLGAVILTFLLQMATIYLPFLNPVYNTEPLTLQELVFCLLLAMIVFFVVVVEKLLVRKGWLYAQVTTPLRKDMGSS